MRKLAIVFFATGLLMFLSACGDSPSDKIYEHLEESVSLEKGFGEQQEPITELEQQEQELYSEIIDLKMDEFDKIKKLSQEALKLIDQRAEKLSLEKESIDQAKEEFLKTESFIAELEDDAAKKKATEMYDKMVERFDVYDKLYQNYEASIKLEKKLYETFQQEDVEQDELKTQLDAINESYEKILKGNDQFNETTEEFNDLKKEFYEAAEIDVVYNNDEGDKQSPKKDDAEKDKE
ncbi:hypothetical protein DX933_05390 [Ornithinibacillus gellani]|uniref:YkyA family protein n=1 Tax=Ornithinibacillus gellani TaxID=2293253 RepID=UPI000F466F34|nr:YkyA family protein [Ornithinibacillus gellani]TQS75708.1 hypothetical protein DX933_05390 [Ornithinibacillus gellani]